MRHIDFSKPPKRKQAVIWRVAGGWFTMLIFIVQGVVLIPFYLEYLGDRLYGFWLASGGVLAWISMVDVGASSVTQQRCAAAFGAKNMSRVVSYFWHGAVVMFGVLSLFAVALFIVGLSLPDLLKFDDEYHSLLIACFYTAGFSAIGKLANDFMLAFAAALQRSQYPVFVEAVGNLLGLCMTVVGLLVLNLGLWSIVLGGVVRSAVAFVVNVGHTFWMLVSINEKNVWDSLIFKDYWSTTPAMLASKASDQFTKNLPTILITRFISPEATVAFSLTVRVVHIVQGFMSHALSGLFAACAHFFHDEDIPKDRQLKTMGQLTQGFFVVSTLGVGLYALLNHGFINLWASEAQFAGQLFTCCVALASFIQMRNSMFVGMGNSAGAIKTVAIMRTVENCFGALMAYACIYYFGLLGAPLAVIVTGLCGQFAYFEIFKRRSEILATSMRGLAWLWLVLLLLLVPIYFAAPYFVVDSWLPYIFYSGLAAIPFGVAFFFGFPGFKEKVVGQFPILAKAGL